MDLTPYVDGLRRELEVAAGAGGAEARELAGRLTAPLDSAVRLTLLNALSDAAGEITRDLAPGSVEVRLSGGEPSFVVSLPPPDEPVGPSGTTEMPLIADDGAAVSRINLRMPDPLKSRIEEAANREGVSINAWLVRAAASALGAAPPRPHGDTDRRPAGRIGQRYTGWVR
ncbi:MAG TPA: toxin-antitoxin system HicB family antitoxin [Pseudonocardiaceae bacterium]